MAKKYKLNKSELSRLKQEEKTFTQFLPVLKLKQEQLQIEKIRIKNNYSKHQKVFEEYLKKVLDNSAVITDTHNPYNIFSSVKIKEIKVYFKSIAGVKVPFLKNLLFKNTFLNFFDTHFWFPIMVIELKNVVKINVELKILAKQYTLINVELKRATQKVNLFEQLLIPETRDAIKRINIVLGDEQVAAVGRAKIAKQKTVNNSLKG